MKQHSNRLDRDLSTGGDTGARCNTGRLSERPIQRHIPNFEDTGLLPKGVHFAEWTKFTKKFGTNSHRLKLMAGLKEALTALKNAGCHLVYIDGSFVTTKRIPNDYDLCYEIIDMRMNLLPIEFAIRGPTAKPRQKATYLGEFYPAMDEAEKNCCYLRFFQSDRNGNRKGIVALFLSDFP